MVVICDADASTVGDADGAMGLHFATAVGGAVGIVGVRDTTVAAGESFIVESVRIGAGEVFCTVGLRDRTTAREDVDIVGLSDMTAGEAVGKCRRNSRSGQGIVRPRSHAGGTL